MIFATPDFGAAGAVMLVLCGIGVIVLGISLAAIARGVILFRRPTSQGKWFGLALILFGVLFFASCCSFPTVSFRLRHETPPLGRYPTGVIRPGMSSDEVHAALGTPHQINDQDPQRVTWLYFLDSFELGWFMVTFTADGKVDHTAGS